MRDSKNILHAKLGVSPMERQYGGGLDAAYMNRRRSSAFAAPDATSAFDSPMSKDGLPTIYREQGGPLPITSVYGQGIPRIIYRDVGGGLSDEESSYQDAYDYFGVSDDNDSGAEPEEQSAGAGQYVSPQRGDPALGPALGIESLGYINPPPAPFRSNNPNYLTYEAQQKMNREIQSPEKGIGGRTPQEMIAGAGVPGFRTSYPSQDIINEDINSMKRAAQNKLNEERKEKANKPDQTSAVSLYLYNVSQHGKTFKATNLPPSALYKAAETPTGVMNLLAAIARGDYGIRAKSLEVPQELIDTANQERANQLNRKTGGGLPTIYRQEGGGMDDDYTENELSDIGGSGISIEDVSFEDPNDTYDQGQLDLLSQAYAPSPTASPNLGYSTSEITAIKEAQRAAAERDEADRRIGYLTGTTRTATDQRTSIPTKEEYEKTLNKYGYEPYQSTYLSGLINKGYDLKEAQSILASAMATPGGIQGMQNAFRDGYSYGGPAGTLLDLLERGTMQSLGIDDVLKKNKEFMEEDRKKDLKDNPDLSESFLDSVGLGGVSKIVDKITDAVSLQGEVSPRVNTAITEQVKGAGWDYTPVSSILAKGMDYGISAVGNLVAPGLGAGLKGLANITDTGKTIGTLTKDGMSFNVNITKDGGRLSINMPTVNYDEGNVSDSDRQSRPVQQKVATSTTEDKKKNYMKDYLAGLDSKEDEGGLSNLKNYYETQALKYVYPDKSDEEINTMINKP